MSRDHCNEIERQGALDHGEESYAQEHMASCWHCRKLWDKHRRIRTAFDAIGHSYERRPDFQAELWAAIDRDQKSLFGRVRRWLRR